MNIIDLIFLNIKKETAGQILYSELNGKRHFLLRFVHRNLH